MHRGIGDHKTLKQDAFFRVQVSPTPPPSPAPSQLQPQAPINGCVTPDQSPSKLGAQRVRLAAA